MILLGSRPRSSAYQVTDLMMNWIETMVEHVLGDSSSPDFARGPQGHPLVEGGSFFAR
jgi:hypothetical protein